jgi:long-subunit fatty acid transport protein
MRLPTISFASLLLAAAAFGQNTDIEALSGLQFNFGNPGARSLAMGGAFIGLADDASAAEANPAGLTVLRKAEVSIEARQTTTAQRFVTGGTFPFVTTADFASRRSAISFASAVIPTEHSVVALYYHRPLSFRNRVDVTGRYSTPIFFVGPNGPVTREQCAAMPDCQQHQIYPFSTAADIDMETFGMAAARRFGTVSIGAAVRYHSFRETAVTFRRDLDLPDQPMFTITQTNGGQIVGRGRDSAVTLVAGIHWMPLANLSVGAIYKEGASFPAPISAAVAGESPAIIGTTRFHVPSTLGAGVGYRVTPALTVNADAVHVSYAHLTDQFLSVIEYGSGDVEQLAGYETRNGIEWHGGLEYFVLSHVPLAVRAGWWRDPAHGIAYRAPLVSAHDVAARILFPGNRAENHYSVGMGLSWPRFEVDAADDTSRSLKTASISVIARQ